MKKKYSKPGLLTANFAAFFNVICRDTPFLLILSLTLCIEIPDLKYYITCTQNQFIQ